MFVVSGCKKDKVLNNLTFFNTPNLYIESMLGDILVSERINISHRNV